MERKCHVWRIANLLMNPALKARILSIRSALINFVFSHSQKNIFMISTMLIIFMLEKSLLIIVLERYSFHFLFHGYGMVYCVFKFDLAEPLEEIWKAVWSRSSIGIRYIGHIKRYRWYKAYSCIYHDWNSLVWSRKTWMDHVHKSR